MGHHTRYCSILQTQRWTVDLVIARGVLLSLKSYTNLQSMGTQLWQRSSYYKNMMKYLVLPKNSFNFREIHFYPAQAMGISHATISLHYPKPVHFSWKINSGVQCAKSAEDLSTVRPNLPKHGGLFLSCGDQDGGTIERVLLETQQVTVEVITS